MIVAAVRHALVPPIGSSGTVPMMAVLIPVAHVAIPTIPPIVWASTSTPTVMWLLPVVTGSKTTWMPIGKLGFSVSFFANHHVILDISNDSTELQNL